ncbi:MAG: hypothetical protein J7L15_09390 [Clostridiales bacterium]|nr:hypothetical protein [Clostridiales bacterium]
MNKIINTLKWLSLKGKQLCCLKGIVAIIFTILFFNAIRCGSVLSAILFFIFALWSYQAIYGRSGCRRSGKAVSFKTSHKFNRDLDI